ncbi:MAG: A24 family peptidase [Bacilli bacterium]|nr:A24 family peptidase [Bacilli bacterium]
MIIILFLIGFILGLVFTLIGEKAPLLLKEVKYNGDNSWILNLFIAISNSLILLISYYEYGFSYEFLVSIVISGLVIMIFISDFKYMIILDTPLIVGGLLVFILRFIYYGAKNAFLSLLSGGILFLLMLLIGLLGKVIFKKDALGGGDIKLAAIMGIILNLRLGLASIILSSLLAMPYALGSIMLSKDKEVPYGPFLIGSMTIVFIFSEKFLNLINYLT